MKVNAKFIGFTSACGGSGTTSAALAMGRTLSRLKEMNVLYMSFDFLGTKCFGKGKGTRKELYDVLVCDEDTKILDKTISEDDYGLKYINFEEFINPLHLQAEQLDFLFKSLSIQYDVIVLDVPSNCMMCVEILPYCDDIVVVYGHNPRLYEFGDNEYYFTTNLCPGSKCYKLYTDLDEASFEGETVDIHGAFAAKVREIADQISF